jgi:hypothetical protein
MKRYAGEGDSQTDAKRHVKRHTKAAESGGNRGAIPAAVVTPRAKTAVVSPVTRAYNRHPGDFGQAPRSTGDDTEANRFETIEFCPWNRAKDASTCSSCLEQRHRKPQSARYRPAFSIPSLGARGLKLGSVTSASARSEGRA